MNMKIDFILNYFHNISTNHKLRSIDQKTISLMFFNSYLNEK